MKLQNIIPRVPLLARAFTAVALLACAAVLTLPSPALAGKGKQKSTRIIPPNVEAYGPTYSGLAGAWWDWAVNQPPGMNPITDETGAFCHVGQAEDFGQGKISSSWQGISAAPNRRCVIARFQRAKPFSSRS